MNGKKKHFISAGTALLALALLPLASCKERTDFSEAKGRASSSLLSRIFSNEIVFTEGL